MRADPEAVVSLAYVEGVVDGRRLLSNSSLGSPGANPLVVVKGGVTEGAQSGASYTALSPPTTRCSMVRAVRRSHLVSRLAGRCLTRPPTFATQPLPRGLNVVVLTTAGGWGVITSDAMAQGLDLISLPSDLMADIYRAARALGNPQQSGLDPAVAVRPAETIPR